MFVNFLLLYIIGSVQSTNIDCNEDIIDGSFVSSCSPTRCESIFDSKPGADLVEWPTTPNTVVQVVSTQKGDRFKIYNHHGLNTDEFYYEESHTNVTSFIDTNIKYQRILGFGTTLTDSSCINIEHLPGDIRLKLIQSYFDTNEGIRLNLIRIPIGSNEYSIVNYALEVRGEAQIDLSTYDNDYRIPLILEAMEAAGRSKNRMKVLACPTTAPIRFKDTLDLQGGKLKRDSMKSYAEYLNNYVLAYKQSGLNIWSLILGDNSLAQSEPTDNNSTRPSSMTMTAEEVKDFVVDHLGPILKDSVKLLALDDQRKFIPSWADTLFKNESSSSMIAGIAHKNVGPDPYDNLIYLTKRYPDKILLASQSKPHRKIKVGNWRYAQDYAIEITKSLQYGSVGWIDFNMALDLWGGPSYANHYSADCAILVDEQNGTFYRNPMFYAIGHFSRYIAPGSIRLKTKLLTAPNMFDLHEIAFLTPDNYIVQVVVNANQHPVPFRVGIDKRTKLEVLLESKSFSTFILNRLN